METEKVSISQIEVWEWKEKAAESVMALPPGERIRMILDRTRTTAAALQRLKSKKPSKVKRPTHKIISGSSV